MNKNDIYSRKSQLTPKYVTIKIKDNHRNKNAKTGPIRYRLNQAHTCF